jgi:hypothetical protein
MLRGFTEQVSMSAVFRIGSRNVVRDHVKKRTSGSFLTTQKTCTKCTHTRQFSALYCQVLDINFLLVGMLCAEMQSQPALIIQFLERQSSSAPLRNTLEEGVAYQMRSHHQEEQDERDERDVMMIVLRTIGWLCHRVNLNTDKFNRSYNYYYHCYRCFFPFYLRVTCSFCMIFFVFSVV